MPFLENSKIATRLERVYNERFISGYLDRGANVD
jgi:hypothetical protein